MAQPTTREEFKQYCLRALGAPVIDINVDEDQLEDRIDDALQKYRDWHDDGTIRMFYKHQVTDSDLTNEYISVPSSITYIKRVMPIGGSTISSTNMFSVKYQIALNDLWDLNSGGFGGLTYYDQTKQYLEMLDMKLNGTPEVEFSRRQNRVYIFGKMDGDDIKKDDYVIIEAYQMVDPEIYSEVWQDGWLKRYCTELFRWQWGSNMRKFDGIQLPGGITISGEGLMGLAEERLDKLTEELDTKYSSPVDFYIG